jgi:hypothetical protein
LLVERARAAAPATVAVGNISSTLAQAVRTAVANCSVTDCAAPALVSRVHRLARQAAARRDGDALRRFDRLLRFATTSPTLGGRAIMAELQESPDRDFVQREVPDVSRRGPVHATVIAAVLFRSGGTR